VGITLHAASTVIFLDRNWSPALNQQAEDRLHRIGQREAVQVIDIMARDTVDLGRRQMLEQKWDWIRRLLGDV
jgi:SWI/SNF-related matrix-associated actin-dependent regulator 1 of chromatin subfamily A